MKTCQHCGATSPPDAMFCQNCGQPFLSEVPTEAPMPVYYDGYVPAPAKKRSALPIILIAVITLALLAVAGIFLFSFFSSGSGLYPNEYENILQYQYRLKSEDGERRFYNYQGTTIDLGDQNLTVQASYDQSLVFRSIYKEDGYYGPRDLTVYDLSGTEILQVKKVGAVSLNNFTNTLYYVKEGARPTLYRMVDGKEEELATKVDAFVYAPNDTYILYTEGKKLFVLQPGKEPQHLADVTSGTSPLGISNDGKWKYYGQPSKKDTHFTENGKICCMNAQGDIKSMRIKARYPDVSFNIDATEMLVGYDCALTLCKKGEFTKILDEGALYVPYRMRYSLSANAEILNVKNFDQFICVETDNKSGKDISYYYNQGELVELAPSSTYDFALNCNMDSVALLYNEKLQWFDLTQKEPVKEKIGKGVDSFALTEDGKTLFYLELDRSDISGTLYRKSFGEEPVLIAEDVSHWKSSYDGTYVNYIQDYDEEEQEGTLFLMKQGQDPVEIGPASTLGALNSNGEFIYFADQSQDNMDPTYSMWIYRDGSAQLLEKKILRGV